MCDVLLTAGAATNVVVSDGLTPLHIAAVEDHFEWCSALVTAGANVNAAKSDGVTPLYIAAQGGRLTTCNVLLAGVDPNATS